MKATFGYWKGKYWVVEDEDKFQYTNGYKTIKVVWKNKNKFVRKTS